MRSGSDTRKATKPVKVYEDTKEEIRRRATRENKTQAELIDGLVRWGLVHSPEAIENYRKYSMANKVKLAGILVNVDDMAIRFNMFEQGWDANLQSLIDKINVYSVLDPENDCPGRKWVDDRWKCIWGQLNAPPKVKPIAKTIEGMKNHCEGCIETQMIKNHTDRLDKQVKELEEALEKKSDMKIRVPWCVRGAEISDDGTQFSSGCPKTKVAVSIVNYCKKLYDGAGCPMLKMKTLAMGTGPEPQIKDMK